MTPEEKLIQIRNLVNEQAEDEGLWVVPPIGEGSIVEAYLQHELRRLHHRIEVLTDD